MAEYTESKMPGRETPAEYDFIKRSQESWRKYRRGMLSRPQELPALSKSLDRSVKSVFGKYIDPDRPAPVIAWSVLRDEPVEPRTYYYEIKRPGNIREEDDGAYYTGINQINEWATDYAATYWMAHSSKNPLAGKAKRIYAEMVVNLEQRTGYRKTYRIMDDLKDTAARHGLDFDDSLFTALFRHDFEGINDIVARARIGGCRSIDDLAVHLGSSLPKINVTKLKRSLILEDNDTDLKKLVKRTALSMFTGGRQVQPGVVEIVVAQKAAAIAASAAIAFDGKGFLHDSAVTAFGAAIITSPWAYELFHETIHAYQKDIDYNGLVPVKLISLEK